MNREKTPRIIYIIVVLTTLTLPRTLGLQFLPTLEMFGGTSPNAWFSAWVTDSILGILIPFVIYFMLKGRGLKTWSLLIIYSTLGAFDYANGLANEWLHPLPVETAAPGLVYSSLLATLIFQVIVLILLFRKNSINYFIKDSGTY